MVGEDENVVMGEVGYGGVGRGVVRGDAWVARGRWSKKLCYVMTGSTHFARISSAHSLTWQTVYNNNSPFQWRLATVDGAPPPLRRAHRRRVAGATSHRPARPLSSLGSRLLSLLVKHEAVAGSVDSRD